MRQIHAEGCGTPCKANCACWCHQGCRVDVEIGQDWLTLKSFDNYRQGETLTRTLLNVGIFAMVSCACGSYAYGECELCAVEAHANQG